MTLVAIALIFVGITILASGWAISSAIEDIEIPKPAEAPAPDPYALSIADTRRRPSVSAPTVK